MCHRRWPHGADGRIDEALFDDEWQRLFGPLEDEDDVSLLSLVPQVLVSRMFGMSLVSLVSSGLSVE